MAWDIARLALGNPLSLLEVDYFVGLLLPVRDKQVIVVQREYIGLKATKNRKIYNGMIKTYFYQFMGPKPPKRNGTEK